MRTHKKKRHFFKQGKGGVGSNPFVTGASNFYTKLPDNLIFTHGGSGPIVFDLNYIDPNYIYYIDHTMGTERRFRVNNNLEGSSGTWQGGAGFDPTDTLSGLIASGRGVYLGGGSGSSSSTTGITGASNIGAGSAIVSGISSNDLKVKSLVGGTNVTLSSDDSTITIDAAGGGGGTLDGYVLSAASGYLAANSSYDITLDGTSNYIVDVIGRKNTQPSYNLGLQFKIDSSDGTITDESDAWPGNVNESYDVPTKTLTLSTDSTHEIVSSRIFKEGAGGGGGGSSFSGECSRAIIHLQSDIEEDFTSGIYDKSIQNNTVTINGVTNSTTQVHRGNSSIYFDGSNSNYLLIPTDYPIYESTNATIESWVYWDPAVGGGSNDDMIIGRATSNPLSDGDYIINLSEDDDTVAIAFGGNKGYSFDIPSIGLPSGEWFHFAFCNNGGAKTLYINGSGNSFPSNSAGGNWGTAGNVYIGHHQAGGNRYSFRGYFQDFRVTRGECVYTGDFTPSTALLPISCGGSSSSSSSTDGCEVINALNNELHIQSNTYSGDTNILDSLGATPITNNNSSNTTEDARLNFGSSNLKFENSNIVISNRNKINLLNGDLHGETIFSIDFWYYKRSHLTSADIDTIFTVEKSNSHTAGNAAMEFYSNPDGSSVFTIPTTTTNITNYTTSNLSLQTWYYITITRSGDSVYFYVDGVEQSSSDVSGQTFYFDSDMYLSIGGRNGANYSSCYIQDFRIRKGISSLNPVSPSSLLTVDCGGGSSSSSSSSSSCSGSGGIGSNSFITGASNFYATVPDQLIVTSDTGPEIPYELFFVNASYIDYRFTSSGPTVANRFSFNNDLLGTFNSRDIALHGPAISLSGYIASGRAVYLGACTGSSSSAVGGGIGSSTFTGLSDAPDSYDSGKFLQSSTTGLDWVDAPAGGGLTGWTETNGHILPNITESYDIGSADYKVRHLFLSDNSLKFVDASDNITSINSSSFTITGLSDTFNSYDDCSGKYLRVNKNEDGVEFTPLDLGDSDLDFTVDSTNVQFIEKRLNTNIKSDQTISDFTFPNLIVGKTYRVSATLSFYSESETNLVQAEIYNGANKLVTLSNKGRSTTASASILFIAAHDTVTVEGKNLSTIDYILGDPTISIVQLELPPSAIVSVDSQPINPGVPPASGIFTIGDVNVHASINDFQNHSNELSGISDGIFAGNIIQAANINSTINIQDITTENTFEDIDGNLTSFGVINIADMKVNTIIRHTGDQDLSNQAPFNDHSLSLTGIV